ncbi:MAG: hypothetical protein QM516_00155 [Limnohabitans sp.]|nr:hypothetical protein [Limnohabitans sp.]
MHDGMNATEVSIFRTVALLDNFPSTHRTHIAETIAQGDHLGAARHVMERAYEPLLLYARQSSLRGIAPAEDLVNGFLASRFAQRDDYLARWLAVQPRVSLRRWLVNGLLLYAHERIAEERRARRAPEIAQPTGQVEPAPWRALEIAWRDGVLQAACDRVSEQYAREGRPEAWRLFTRHILDGRPYPELERELGISALSAPSMTRTVLRRLRAEIDAILTEEFPDPTERARELDAILFDDGHDARE